MIRVTAFFAFAALGLAACDETPSSTSTIMRDATAAAEAACVALVNQNNGTATGTMVTSSEYSEANSEVLLSDQTGTNWRCLASNDGVVADLAVVE